MLADWIAGSGGPYFDAVWAAVTRAQAQAAFRGDPAYRTILEHVPEWEGRACLELLEDPTIKAVLKGSEGADQIGGAELHDFGGSRLSATTVRYAKVLQDLTRFFPTFARMRSVVEIGIGYGGQARIISDHARTTGGHLHTYDLIDMLPVTLLAQSYLDNFRLHFACRFQTKSQIARDASWDLAISNYAFSEFGRGLQTEYLDNVLLRAASGYVTMNTGKDHFNPWNADAYTVDELVEALPNAVVIAEQPATGPHNYIIVYGRHACNEPRLTL